MKEITRDFAYSSSFFWDSELSELRREEIGEWIQSLSEENYKKLKDIVKDVRDEIRWETSSY